jgi:hypothetical protein
LVVVIDCSDPARSVRFWSGVLGFTAGRDQWAVPVMEDGWRWHILADPDGNEFCVLQPPRQGQPMG